MCLQIWANVHKAVWLHVTMGLCELKTHSPFDNTDRQQVWQCSSSHMSVSIHQAFSHHKLCKLLYFWDKSPNAVPDCAQKRTPRFCTHVSILKQWNRMIWSIELVILLQTNFMWCLVRSCIITDHQGSQWEKKWWWLLRPPRYFAEGYFRNGPAGHRLKNYLYPWKQTSICENILKITSTVLLKWNGETLMKWLSEQFWGCCLCLRPHWDVTRASVCVCVVMLKENVIWSRNMSSCSLHQIM